MKQTAIILSGLFICVGCATSAAQRETAAQTATNITLVEKKVDAFSAARSESDAARQRAANRSLESALETEAINDVRVQRWKAAADEDRSKLFDAILAATAAAAARNDAARAEIVAAEKLADATKSRVALRSDLLTKSAKALAQLGEKEKPQDTLAFYRSFFGEVKKSLDQAHDAATRAANAGAASVAQIKTIKGGS